MKGYLPAFNMKSAKSLDGAYRDLANRNEYWQPFAGGTDLMVLFESGVLKEGNFLDISKISQLQNIASDKEKIVIGSLATFTDIQNHSEIVKLFPNLIAAAREIGGVAIQNRATIGGNIINASPAADSPPALMSYDAKLNIGSLTGIRQIAIKDFYLDYKKMNFAGNELLISIELPRPKEGSKHFYRKVGTRKAQAISKVVCAGLTERKGPVIHNLRYSVGSVGPKTILCTKTNSFLQGKVLDAKIIADAVGIFESEISPIDDIRSTCTYRMNVSKNIFQNFLENLS